MSSKFYHASTSIYSPGISVSAPGNCIATQQRLQNNNKWSLECEFDKIKPPSAVSRIGALYACRLLEESYVYAAAEPGLHQNGIPTCHFYEVSLQNPTCVPMVLVNRADVLLKQSSTQSMDAAIVEYWNPTYTWRFLEYLSVSMTVLGMVNAPSPDSSRVASVRIKYGVDLDNAKMRFP